MTLDHEQAKIVMALVDLAGLPERTGLTPAEIVSKLVALECSLEGNARAVPDARPPCQCQLSLPGLS